MDAAALDELRTLRARAYGPDADIQDDPIALARLRELEAALAPPAPPADAAEDQGMLASVPMPAGVPVVDDGDADEAAETEDVATPVVPTSFAGRVGRWSRRRKVIATLVIGLVVVLVTATISTFVARRAGYGSTVEAVLPAAPDSEWPEFFGPERGGTIFADFYGFTPIVVGGEWTGGYNSECLQLVDTAQVGGDGASYSGYMPGGCGAGVFSPSVSFLVGAQMPEQLRDRFADGTALQFRLEGSEVVVLSSPPIAEPVESREP